MLAFVVVGLMAFPPLALIVVSALYRSAPRRRSFLVMGAALMVLATVVAAKGGLRLLSPAADTGWLLLCYGAYCVLAAGCLAMRPRALRAAALVVTALPIVAGYLLCTVGLLGLMFIVQDAAQAPAATVTMADNMVCETTWWGMAATDSGYALRLYRPVFALPFLRREVAAASVNETANDPDLTCVDLAGRIAGRRRP